MIFDSNDLGTLAELADVLIPAGEGFPSASAANVTGDGLNQVLAVRPDLGDGIKKLIAVARGRVPTEIVAEWQAKDPSSFDLLAELVAGAYFLNPQVRASLGYDGQTARPIDSRPDYLDDGLLQSVIDRGPIYRPTPGQVQRPSRR